ncbi:hypothetical protein Tco_1347589, partial [Tanacetum coccineum]
MEDDRTESNGELNIDFEEDKTEMEDDKTESDREITIYFEEDRSHKTKSQGISTTMNILQLPLPTKQKKMERHVYIQWKMIEQKAMGSVLPLRSPLLTT